MRHSWLPTSALIVLAGAMLTSCSSHASSSAQITPNAPQAAASIPSAPQSGATRTLLKSAANDGRLARLWAHITDAKAHPVARLPRKGDHIDGTTGVALERDLVDLLDDTVFHNQPRERGIRLFTLDRKSNPSTSSARSPQFVDGPGGGGGWGVGSTLLVYIFFVTPEEIGLLSDDILSGDFNPPLCLEFDPDWLANFLENFKPHSVDGGTPGGCDLYASNCYLISGDDANVLFYSGGGGIYTGAPWGCQDTGSGWLSTVDGMGCSTWQVWLYENQYVGQNQDVPLDQILPPWKVSMSLASANVNEFLPYPTGGHLYYTIWQKVSTPTTRMTVAAVLQAGPDGPQPLLTQQFYLQCPLNPFCQLPDPTVFFAFPGDSSYLLQSNLLDGVGVYNQNASRGHVPTYGYLIQNSNTWVNALGVAAGLPSSLLNTEILWLQTRQAFPTPRIAYGYDTPPADQLLQFFQNPNL